MGMARQFTNVSAIADGLPPVHRVKKIEDAIYNARRRSGGRSKAAANRHLRSGIPVESSRFNVKRSHLKHAEILALPKSHRPRRLLSASRSKG